MHLETKWEFPNALHGHEKGEIYFVGVNQINN